MRIHPRTTTGTRRRARALAITEAAIALGCIRLAAMADSDVGGPLVIMLVALCVCVGIGYRDSASGTLGIDDAESADRASTGARQAPALEKADAAGMSQATRSADAAVATLDVPATGAAPHASTDDDWQEEPAPEPSRAAEPVVVAGPSDRTKPAADVMAASAATDDDDGSPGLEYSAFALRLVMSPDPLDELKLFVRDIRKRRRRRSADFPTPFERYAARLLTEAGVLARDVELPAVSIVLPPASGMLYLRFLDESISHEALVRLLAIEAALNAVRLSAAHFDRPDDHTLVEHYRYLEEATRCICAQSPNLADRVPVIEDDDPDTEWAVRLGISTAIESLQLPHRLEADFRTNVADGNVAIRIGIPPEGAFPASTYLKGFGLVPSSRDMRRRAASDYALRLGLLVAACTFRCSDKVLHVWISAHQQLPNRQICLLSVDFDRWRFGRIDLARLGDLGEVYRTFAATFRLEDGILRPVTETFALTESRFCPPRRYTPVSLSSRRLDQDHAKALGTTNVSGLAIDESTKRQLVASHLMQAVGKTTEESVHAILELAADDPDPTVRSAAERCVRKLIAGEIEGDAFSICAEFVGGDGLSSAVRAAQESLSAHRLLEARDLLRSALGRVDREGVFADSATIEYRHFTSYVDRVLYNRLFALPGHTALLVPEAYYEAHLLLSVTSLMAGDVGEALVHARRLVEMAPLDTRARLHLARCLELSGDMDGARQTIAELLLVAHDPEGLGTGYYRMAFFQWRAHNMLAAQVCYQRAMQYLPQAMPMIAMELTAMALQNPGALRDDLDAEESDELLQEHGVPVAPTDLIKETFDECARAALDAEVFPVARNFVQVLSGLRHDDILMGLIRSIEDAPEE